MILDYILFNYFLFKEMILICSLVLLFLASFVDDKKIRFVFIVFFLSNFLLMPFLANLGTKRICSFLEQTYETCSVSEYKREGESRFIRILIKGNFKKNKNVFNIENKKESFFDSYDVFIVKFEPKFQILKSEQLDEIINRKKEILDASKVYFEKQLKSRKERVENQ